MKIIAFIQNILRGISSFFVFIAKQIGIFIQSFKKPMASSVNSFRGLIIALLVGLLSIIVVMGIQPFGISEFTHPNKSLLLVGFGLIAFVGVLFSKFILPLIFSSFYDDSHWTIAHQITHLTVTAFFIACLFMFYGNKFVSTNILFTEVILFSSVLLVPIIVITFIQQNIFETKFSSIASQVNQGLNSISVETNKQLFPVIVLGKGALSLIPNQLIFAETGKTTSTFHWQTLAGIEKTTLDIPLAEVEKELFAHPQFVRFHKNYIININGIHSIHGNARGYRLKIVKSNTEVPVRWRFHKTLENLGQ